MTTIPNKLRQFRTKRGLLQQDIVDSLGLASTDRISHWERGTAIPSLSNLFRLSVLYKTTIEDLYPEYLNAVRIELLGRQEGLSV